MFQPEWSPYGVLHFVSDRDGWWNLYAWHGGETVRVLACARDGLTIHGLFYRPHERADGPPPLVVKAHPGPTANVAMRLDWHTQYLQRVRGRRDRLPRQHRIRARLPELAPRCLGTQRCSRLRRRRSAPYFARQSRRDADGHQGASAGGYTALRALILTDVFAGGIARSPVIDPQTWRETTPKFQAHHCDGLIGPWPEAATLYQASR